MGIDNPDVLADPEAPATLNPPPSAEDIAKHAAKHRDAADEARHPRANVEQEFAEMRDKIDEDFKLAVSELTATRDANHAANQEQRKAALEVSGLNPNGSHPQGREQGDFSA